MKKLSILLIYSLLVSCTSNTILKLPETNDKPSLQVSEPEILISTEEIGSKQKPTMEPIPSPLSTKIPIVNLTPLPSPIETPNYLVFTNSIVSTLAGSTKGYLDATGTNAKFEYPYNIAVDKSGNIYVLDSHKIRKITPTGVVSTLAGSSEGYIDGTGTNAKFSRPSGITTDISGNIFISEQSKIRKITLSGVVSTFAVSGPNDYFYSQDGKGTNANFFDPSSMAADKLGNIFFIDRRFQRIRKITQEGVVTTIAGGIRGKEDGIGTNAQFNFPEGIAIDHIGNIFVGDSDRIRKITQDGVVSTFVGGGFSRFIIEDGEGTNVQLGVSGLAIDSSNNIYVAERTNNKIRKVSPKGVVTTLAGSYSTGIIFGEFKGGNVDGTSSNAEFNFPSAVAVDNFGNIYVSDYGNYKIRKILQ